MFSPDLLQRALVGLPILLLSVTVHEYAHAWSAFKFGDTTARDAGRLTLFPLAHLDWMGVLVMILSGFRFGWAKPVPVNPFNLRNPRVADFWISAAGPLSNVGLAILSTLLLRFVLPSLNVSVEYLNLFLYEAVWINLALAFFNLIPLFPLDGSHILRNVLPEHYGPTLDRLESFAPILLIIIVFSGALWYIIRPFVNFFGNLLLG